MTQLCVHMTKGTRKFTEVPEERNIKTKALTYTTILKSDDHWKIFVVCQIIAYCFRLKNNALNATKRTSGPITIDKMQQATLAIIKNNCQMNEFSQELHDLHKNGRIY